MRGPYWKVPYAPNGRHTTTQEVQQALLEITGIEFEVNDNIGYPCVQFLSAVTTEQMKTIKEELHKKGFKEVY